MISSGYKKTGARPVKISGGSLGVEASLAAVEGDIGCCGENGKRRRRLREIAAAGTVILQVFNTIAPL